jgi:hypothetical protein
MKRARRRERDDPANRSCNGTTKIVIASNPDPGAGGRAARCGAARKDLEDDHAAAAARARRAMTGRGARIGCVVRYRRLDLRDWGADKLLGACDVIGILRLSPLAMAGVSVALSHNPQTVVVITGIVAPHPLSASAHGRALQHAQEWLQTAARARPSSTIARRNA